MKSLQILIRSQLQAKHLVIIQEKDEGMKMALSYLLQQNISVKQKLKDISRQFRWPRWQVLSRSLESLGRLRESTCHLGHQNCLEMSFNFCSTRPSENVRQKPNLPIWRGNPHSDAQLWATTWQMPFSGRGDVPLSGHTVSKLQRPAVLQMNIEGLTAR